MKVKVESLRAWVSRNRCCIGICLLLLSILVVGYHVALYLNASLPIYQSNIFRTHRPIWCIIDGSEDLSYCKVKDLISPPEILSFVKEELQPKLESTILRSKVMESWLLNLEVTPRRFRDVGNMMMRERLFDRKSPRSNIDKGNDAMGSLHKHLSSFLNSVYHKIESLGTRTGILTDEMRKLASVSIKPTSSTSSRFLNNWSIFIGRLSDPARVLTLHYRHFLAKTLVSLQDLLTEAELVASDFTALLDVLENIIGSEEGTDEEELSEIEKYWLKNDPELYYEWRNRYRRARERTEEDDYYLKEHKDLRKTSTAMSGHVSEVLVVLQSLADKFEILQRQADVWEQVKPGARDYGDSGHDGDGNLVWFPILDVSRKTIEVGTTMRRMSGALETVMKVEPPEVAPKREPEIVETVKAQIIAIPTQIQKRRRTREGEPADTALLKKIQERRRRTREEELADTALLKDRETRGFFL